MSLNSLAVPPRLPLHQPPVGEEPLARSRARCADGAGSLSFLFFSDDDFEIARARAICRKCELSRQCLSGALARGEVYGVWGGEILVDGVIVRDRPRRGRPPRVPRPIEVVAEVPLPPHLIANGADPVDLDRIA